MSTGGDALRNYLEQVDHMRREMGENRLHDWEYQSCEGYVLANGKLYESQELTPEEWDVVSHSMGSATWKIKECWYNSRLLVLRAGLNQIVYVEGYALGAVIPVQHAWCEINGKVIDPTWSHRDQPKRKGPFKTRTMGLISDDMAYYGVAFSDNNLVFNVPGSVIDDWKNEYPLLRGDHAKKAV